MQLKMFMVHGSKCAAIYTKNTHTGDVLEYRANGRLYSGELLNVVNSLVGVVPGDRNPNWYVTKDGLLCFVVYCMDVHDELTKRQLLQFLTVEEYNVVLLEVDMWCV